jgi:type I restriction enzyme S subunit
VREDGLSENNLVYISESSNMLLKKSRVFTGDLVAVRSGQPGITAVVDERFNGANCIDVIIIRKSPLLLSEYLAYFLNSEPARVQFLQGSDGAIQQHFNVETAQNLNVPVPPLDEQQRLVKYLREETARIDELKMVTEESIALLQERRTALIEAAVTGQLGAAEET